MNKEQMIAELNAILSLEYTAVLQYTHQAFLLTGLQRPHYLPMFRAEAAESLTHAQLVGDKIVSLGGVPTTEVGEVQSATSLEEMLRNNLALERSAVAAYARALALADDDVSLRVMLENQVAVERASVEELERILGG